MHKWIFEISLFFVAISITACIEEINFEPPNEFQNAVVIDGKIIKGNPSKVEVGIQNVFDFSFEEEIYFNAQEVIVFNSKGEKLNIPQNSTGLYKTNIDVNSDFEVEFGLGYGIEVSLFDGRKFQSDLEILIPGPAMDKFEHNIETKTFRNEDDELVTENIIAYKVSTGLIAEENQKPTSIRWELIRTYKQSDVVALDQCYITTSADQDQSQIIKIEDQGTNSNLEDFLILEQPISQDMVEGQYITIVQEALDNGALEYWEQINELSTNSGTFYENPPGQIISNFKSIGEKESRVFGYFYATEHDSLHAFVDSTFVDMFTPTCPRPKQPRPGQNGFSDFGPCDDCCFCLWLDNSTTQKPYFWVD